MENLKIEVLCSFGMNYIGEFFEPRRNWLGNEGIWLVKRRLAINYPSLASNRGNLASNARKMAIIIGSMAIKTNKLAITDVDLSINGVFKQKKTSRTAVWLITDEIWLLTT